MVKLIRSEAIKLKNKAELYASIFFAIISVVVIYLIFNSKTKIDITSRMDVQMSFALILISINTLFIARQACMMEKKANMYQNILTFQKPYKLWIYKLILLVFVQFVLFVLAEIIGLFIVKQALSLNKVMIGILIHIIITTNIHMYLQSRYGDYPNIIVGVFEIILIIFSTNIPMDNWYIFPCCYGYKIYENFNSISVGKWLVVLIVVLLSVFMNILLASKSKFYNK